MHVTKPSLDVDDFGCEYTALCCISLRVFFVSRCWTSPPQMPWRRILDSDPTGAGTNLLFEL